MVKKISGQIFGIELIEYEIELGEYKGNSTETTITISSSSLEDENDVIIKIFGSIEREDLSDALLEISEHLKNN